MCDIGTNVKHNYPGVANSVSQHEQRTAFVSMAMHTLEFVDTVCEEVLYMQINVHTYTYIHTNMFRLLFNNH